MLYIWQGKVKKEKNKGFRLIDSVLDLIWTKNLNKKQLGGEEDTEDDVWSCLNVIFRPQSKYFDHGQNYGQLY